MFKDFREFVMRGNVLDLAVAVIIGAAFGSVIDSLVKDVIMPPIGLLVGGVDFSSLYINLSGTAYESYALAKEAGAAVIGVGAFINTLINFLIIAFAVFLIVRAVNQVRRQEAAAPAAPPAPTTEEKLLTEIRDLLREPRR